MRLQLLSGTRAFVMHQMRFAHTMADRVVFFDSGRIIEDRPPASVLDNPQQKRTQDFPASLTEAS